MMYKGSQPKLSHVEAVTVLCSLRKHRLMPAAMRLCGILQRQTFGKSRPQNAKLEGTPFTAGCREDENFRIARALIFFLPFSLLFRLAAPKHLTGWGGRGEQLAAQCKRWRASRPLPAVQPSPGPAQDSRRPSPSLCGAPRGLLSRRCRSTRRSCPRARRAQKANA